MNHNCQPDRRWAVAGIVGLTLLGLVVLAGCTGVTTPGEKLARQDLQTVAHSFRPAGQTNALPKLTGDSSLGDFLSFAMLNQPKVEAAYFDWVASIERITTARSRPDPQLTFQTDIQNIVTSLMPGLMMNFPGPGKLRAGADVASAESQARYFVFAVSVLETAYDVKRACYQLQFLEEKIRVNRQMLDLLTDLEKLARTQNEVGKVTLQDVLRAQIEQDRMRSEIANIEDSRQPLRAQFKAALGLRADQPDPPLPGRFESTPLNLGADQLFADALAHSPRLKAMEAEVRAAEAAIGLAYKARVPDYSVGLMADVKMSPTLYRPLATMSLPIWRDKIAAQLAEAQANKRSAAARLNAAQIGLVVDFAENTFAFREASRNLELLTTRLLPKANQSLAIARSGYLSGQIDFFNLLDAERTLLNFQLEEVEQRTQRELVLANLSLVVLGQPPARAPLLASPSDVPLPSPNRFGK